MDEENGEEEGSSAVEKLVEDNSEFVFNKHGSKLIIYCLSQA